MSRIHFISRIALSQLHHKPSLDPASRSEDIRAPGKAALPGVSARVETCVQEDTGCPCRNLTDRMVIPPQHRKEH